MNTKKTNRILIATGPTHSVYEEISVETLVDNYDYQYFSNFMEHWARDCVSSYISTEDDDLVDFVNEYLRIAHHDLVVEDIA